MVQLRNKVDDVGVVEAQARAVKNILAGTGVAFVMNDYVELAAKLGLDGVHIGQEDMDPARARAILGPDKILGVTAFTREHYADVNPDIVDYVGTGPVYPTLTKPGKPVLGVDGFADLVRHAPVPVPVVGIGGITAENARAVIDAGAQGVAMMRSVSEAQDVEAAAREFVQVVRV